MDKKAFTLVEVLAVIVILMLLAVLITPNVLKQLNLSQETAFNEQINEVIEASKIYMSQNTNLLPEDGEYIITFNELKNSGLLTSNKIVNPKTQEFLTGCIKVKYENNKYKYEYEDIEDNCIK